VILPGALASAFTMAATARLRGKFDARISVVIGVAIFMLAMWQMSHFTTLSGRPDFLWPMIWRGVGLGLIFVPMTNLALAELPMAKIPNGTGLYNLLRQLGGSVGISISATLLSRFGTTQRAILAEHLTRFDDATRERLAGLTHAVIARGVLPANAEAEALSMLNAEVTRQAMMLSFERLFLLFGIGFALATPLLLLMRKGKGFQGASESH
jgi:DHA2 family multidrug resistance protein